MKNLLREMVCSGKFPSRRIWNSAGDTSGPMVGWLQVEDCTGMTEKAAILSAGADTGVF